MLSVVSRVTVLLLATFSSSLAAELSLSFVTPKSVYRVGDEVPMHVVWWNTSAHPLRVLPDIPAAPNGCFKLRALDSSKRPTILACGQLSIDFESAFKDAKLLKPGRSYSRDIGCKFVSKLPTQYWGSKPSGLYLLWGITAARLSAPGRYEFTARYDMPPGLFDREVAQYFKPALLWTGKTIYGPPVVVEFRAN